MHTRSLLTRAAALAFCCLVSSAGNSLLGQEPEVVSQQAETKPPEVVSEEVERQLWIRGREVLHTGDPLDVVGLEEGDNGFRQRTPVLEQSDRAVAMVDPEENYRRRLAMYDARGSFTEPLRLSSIAAPKSPFASNRPVAGSTTPVEEADGGSQHPLLWIGSLTVAFLLFLRWWIKHRTAWQ